MLSINIKIFCVTDTGFAKRYLTFNKKNLAIFVTILTIIAILIPLCLFKKKQEKIFIIGDNRYIIQYDKSWKEFSNNAKNQSVYLTSFKFSDQQTVINLYRVDSEGVKKWREYVESIEREIDGPLIAFKYRDIAIGQYIPIYGLSVVGNVVKVV